LKDLRRTVNNSLSVHYFLHDVKNYSAYDGTVAGAKASKSSAARALHWILSSSVKIKFAVK
jgi:hypothetical protein